MVLPSLSVTTSTQGVELDPDGYSLVIDGAQNQPIGPAATVVIEGLADGQHILELSGLAGNCSSQGENPRTVSVRSNATATSAFMVTCSASSGSIEVVTSTSGGGSDPDGFAVILDGAERGPIGLSANATLGGVAPGAHSVGLTGLAGNCQVVGENPHPVTVSPGQTVQVPFTVTCVTPGPGAGTLDVTTATSGPDQDPDGYSVSLDGGAAQPIGTNGTLSLPNVSSSAHTVELLAVAPNCSVTGSNPRTVSVTASQTTTAAFAVTCTQRPGGTGSVRVTAATSGSSPDNQFTVRVDGAGAQSLSENDRTFGNLSAGAHTVLLGDVAQNCTVTGGNSQTVTVVAGQTATAAFAVTCAATGSSVNLRVERMYLTQSVQRARGDVPLVEGKEALLRVFVTASGTNSARPAVRVRLSRGGAVVQTFAIAPTRSSTPTSVEEGTLGSSWNVSVPGSLIASNTSVLVDVDPDNTIAETNEADNSFPVTGSQPLTVQSVPAASIRFVPIRQTSTGLQGNAANPSQMMDLARRIYPLNEIRTSVREVFTVAGPLQWNDGNGQWGQILSDLDALRIADNAGEWTYFGIAKLDYSSGMVGNGWLGAPTAVGTDDPSEVRWAVAHELGHTWGQWHTPSCDPTPSTVDPSYPYRDGNIGVYGYDLIGGALRSPSLPDVMGYCDNPWISDYIYERVMNFRRTNAGRMAASVAAQPAVLVWGRIVDGLAVLEPTFQIVSRPHLPKAPGPYSLAATASDGTPLFSLSFDATPLADNPTGSRHFAFAVPLDQARAARLASLRLSGPGIRVAALTQSQGRLQRAAGTNEVTVQREAGGVRLQWDASAHPVIMVRDPDTGQVLSFARGGNAQVWTGKGAVDLELSDGVRSHGVRRAISR